MVIAVECVELRGAAWRGGGYHLTVRAANFLPLVGQLVY